MNLNELIIYTDFAKDPMVGLYSKLIRNEDADNQRDHYFSLIRETSANGMSLKEHFYSLLLKTETPILNRLSCGQNEPHSFDLACLNNDLTILEAFMNQPPSGLQIKDPHNLLKHLWTLPTEEPFAAYDKYFSGSKDRSGFIDILKKFGNGPYAYNNAYYINDMEKPVAVNDFDPLHWDLIYDYDLQKKALLANTKAFIHGHPYHHVLLEGASGTGKSSSVKAIANLLGHEKLRLIQVYKDQMPIIPRLIDKLRRSPFKFILFFDDLSFEVNEEAYKLLKSYIEGGITTEAGNVAFYVTSNRQHLIKEVRSEREGDIHLQDFIQEMTSLSKRFGLHLTFAKPDPQEYLTMVEKMLNEKGIPYDKDAMILDARRWALRHRGMSGRIAMQYVKHLQMIHQSPIPE